MTCSGVAGIRIEVSGAALVRRALAVFLFTLAGVSPAAAQGGSPDPRVSAIVSQVSQTRVQADLAWLQAFGTRYARALKADEAAQGLLLHFQQLGLSASLDPFTVPGITAFTPTNVVATIPGRSLPGEIVLVGAHYDSYSPTPGVYAPGADDNASGTAAVMELARVLAGASFARTVVLVAFGAEELGLYGSYHYAMAARARGDQIVGMISLDMVGYVDVVPENLDLIVNTASSPLADRFVAAAQRYTALPVVKRLTGDGGSDHEPFWNQGYTALLAISDDPPTDPNYHATTDTVDKLNLPFLASVVQATAATIADLAAPFGPGFTDDPLHPGITKVKAGHVAELRQAVADLRSRFGLAAPLWTDPALTAGASVVKAVHVAEIRSALADVYTAAKQTPPTYSAPTLTARSTLVRAVDIEELRAAVLAIW
jgi:hypothetical protein